MLLCQASSPMHSPTDVYSVTPEILRTYKANPLPIAFQQTLNVHRAHFRPKCCSKVSLYCNVQIFTDAGDRMHARLFVLRYSGGVDRVRVVPAVLKMDRIEPPPRLISQTHPPLGQKTCVCCTYTKTTHNMKHSVLVELIVRGTLCSRKLNALRRAKTLQVV